jgi:hypothetical protein
LPQGDLSFAWSSPLPGEKTCFFLGDLLQSENKATVAYHTMESLIELKQKSWQRLLSKEVVEQEESSTIDGHSSRINVQVANLLLASSSW